MDKMEKKIGDLGVIPVVKIMNANNSINLGKALVRGGVPVAEITFRTEAAEEAIRKIQRNS